MKKPISRARAQWLGHTLQLRIGYSDYVDGCPMVAVYFTKDFLLHATQAESISRVFRPAWTALRKAARKKMPR